MFVTFDHNNRIFLTAVRFNGDGLWKTDNINRMITFTEITLSGFHCICTHYKFVWGPTFWYEHLSIRMDGVENLIHKDKSMRVCVCPAILSCNYWDMGSSFHPGLKPGYALTPCIVKQTKANKRWVCMVQFYFGV